MLTYDGLDVTPQTGSKGSTYPGKMSTVKNKIDRLSGQTCFCHLGCLFLHAIMCEDVYQGEEVDFPVLRRTRGNGINVLLRVYPTFA